MVDSISKHFRNPTQTNVHINMYLNTFDTFRQSYIWNILSYLYLKTYNEN